MTSTPQLVFLDLDNTVYDWVGSFARSLDAMVADMADALGTDSAIVDAQLQTVFQLHGSLEYAYCAFHVGDELPDARRREFVISARSAFCTQRERSLIAYPGVARTLDVLRQRGVRLVATTNAPVPQAARRLEILGLLDRFDAIAGRQGFAAPPGLEPNGVTWDAYPHGPMKVWTFPDSQLKPGKAMYLRALEHFGVAARAAMAVGDNIAKDLVPALAIGARAAWARYGTSVDEAHWQRLLAVTPWTTAEAQASRRRHVAPEVQALDRFDELLALID